MTATLRTRCQVAGTSRASDRAGDGGGSGNPVATGSATVSITAAGIVAPLAGHLATPEVSLIVLAIGARSLFFSHVNDVGFWMIKHYFGLSVSETIESWSVMETIISVVGLVGALLLDLVI
ncbi:MAG TPA: hypothetical protein VFL94_06660 [Actinomycetales bacterium]|nr:hypothetical protein [Actinomycetales bacterium]